MRQRGALLALAAVTALTCSGCARTGEDAAVHQAGRLALEDAREVAEEIERRQFPRGRRPEDPRLPPCPDQRRDAGEATVCVRRWRG